jgi:OOP family OmpA-OmpF porin
MDGNWLNQFINRSLFSLSFISCLSLLFPIPVFCDRPIHASFSPKATQLYNEAAKHYIQRDYQEAIPLLKQAIKKDKKFIPAYIQLALIYQHLDESGLSLAILDQAYQHLRTNKQADLHYEVARLYYSIGAYSQAQTVLQGLSDLKGLSPSIINKIKTLEQNLYFALDKIQHPFPIHPRKLPFPLNQFESQYFPILTVDQTSLIFTACADKTVLYPENIYISHQDKQGNWSKPVFISERINSPNSNEGTCTISADKKMLVFTSCSREGNYGTCDLYISHQENGVWSEPKNLGPQVNSTGWQSQPSLASDGRTLYFVSERPSNYGKKDIWKSTLGEDGQWSLAVNLGPPINSTAHEISPFIHPNGQTLFFASDRTPSMGGFDIYYSNYIDGQWSEPVNLGYPINNYKDQVSLFITADGKKAYYAGGKQTGAHYHKSVLYEFDIPENLIAMPKSDFVKIQVLDLSTEQPISADITLYELSSNNEQPKLKVDTSDGETILVVNEGKEYLIYVNKDGYLFEAMQVSYPTNGRATVSPPGSIKLKPIALNQSKILKNIYFGFDDYSIEKQSTIELHRLVAFLRANPQIHIELEGHTDDIGPTDYNTNLSIKRAQAIYNYLFEAGISTHRLTYQGYGSSRPLAPNDTSINRQLNRRVAFRITQV